MPVPPTDLTQRPPRSPRVRLGGFVILPRILDKGRATLAGTNGDYTYACPMDMRFFEFTGLDPDLLKAQLDGGRTDAEILGWVASSSSLKRTDSEIAAWSEWQERRSPTDPESRDYFNKLHSSVAPHREDIATWFDLLDLDDFISFGGRG